MATKAPRTVKQQTAAPATSPVVDLRATREHIFLTSRRDQLTRNLLAKAGGGPYINERLSRFGAESETSWAGSADRSVKPRRDRAYLINYAGRIISKNVQFVFGQAIARDGIDSDWENDATKTGLSIDGFMKDVFGAYLAGQWSWIQVDRGAPAINESTGKPGIRSLKDRAQAGDKIFFSLWNSTEVVDWRFGPDGTIERLITEEIIYDNEDEAVEPELKTLRTVWRKGGGVRLFLSADGTGRVLDEEPFTISANIVPFVPIGFPTDKPYVFDDLERIQAALLNLESAHNDNLLKAVFPQLILPSGIIDEVMAKSERSFDDALELIRGLEYPLLETEASNGLTRYIMPDAANIDSIPKDILRLRKEMFDIAGQALKGGDSKQVESAEAKAWDNQDIEATLADNAEIMEEVETKAVDIARQLDSTFKVYAPAYPRQFDLPDLERDFAVITQLEASGNIPESIIRALAKAKVKVLSRVVHLSDEVVAKAYKEIDEMDIADLQQMASGVYDSSLIPDPES